MRFSSTTEYNEALPLISQLVRVEKGTGSKEYRNIPIKINSKFCLSIQAGEYAYSTPREDYPSNKHYIEFEVAIFHFKNEDWEWFPVSNKLDFLSWSSYFEQGDSTVAGYLDQDTIKTIIKDLIRLSDLIEFV